VGLDTDLAATPAGDLTPVGEGGTGLSRVALARALYQPCTSIYLFDDILASLDSHVAQVGTASGLEIGLTVYKPWQVSSAPW
jgi:ABC-type transport system involved in cytochrome bd biosynthesis fused ATPase/permease subunit